MGYAIRWANPPVRRRARVPRPDSEPRRAEMTQFLLAPCGESNQPVPDRWMIGKGEGWGFTEIARSHLTNWWSWRAFRLPQVGDIVIQCGTRPRNQLLGIFRVTRENGRERAAPPR